MQVTRLQLALPFPRHTAYDARDFIPAASNNAARAWLDRVAEWPDRRLALWGPAGCGKSHLVHMWVERHAAHYLMGQSLRALEDLPSTGAVAVDDADTVAQDETLLHLLNTARERGLFLLMSGRAAPARWPFRLADLSSRLRAVTSTEIEAPDDTLLRTLLLRLLADRQLHASQSAQDWLLSHLPRAPAALQEAVARLDHASLTYGRAITRSFAAHLLTEAACDGETCQPDSRLLPL